MSNWTNQDKSEVTSNTKYFLLIDDSSHYLLIDDFSTTGHKLIISTGTDTSPIEWTNQNKS